MRVSEFSRRAQVSPEVIRYYTRLGLLKPSRDPENRYRIFSDADLKRILFIRRAKRLGYTLAEIAEILHESSKGKSPCPKVREIIQRRIKENRNDLEELTALHARMENALALWETMPDGIPDGDSICHLIESAEEL
ncbi:MAG: MerR family transcriptional regulator [Bacteroidetes bacterium]|nr:MerR family transcriptional regulator [Bacteroidota bacterium]